MEVAQNIHEVVYLLLVLCSGKRLKYHYLGLIQSVNLHVVNSYLSVKTFQESLTRQR